MTRSSDQVARDLEAQLQVQRSATTYYQKLLGRAYENLRMLGRTDIVKAIEAETLREMSAGSMREVLTKQAAAPQPAIETQADDDLY